MLSTRELWNVITGRSSLSDPEAVGEELSRCNSMLLSGIDYYKKPSATSSSKLKTSSNVKRKEFLLELSRLLDLDEWQTHELFQNYLRLEFRGSGPQLQAILHHEAQLEGFHIKLLQFYFKERYYLLKCLKYLISYWQDGTCLYHNEFAKVIDESASKNLIQTIIKQLENRFKALPNHERIKGVVSVQMEFTTQFIKEQIELAEIILLYYKDFEMPADVLMTLAKLFRRQHFGNSQVTRKYMNSHAEQLTERLGFITSLILLQGLDLEFLHKSSIIEETSVDIKDHHLLRNNFWKEIDKLFYTWDDLLQQGPVLLGWAVFRHMCLSGQEQQLTGLFGSSALKCNVTQYIEQLLCYYCSNALKESPSASLVKSLIYILMSLVLRIFDEDSVGDQKNILSILCKIVSEPCLASLLLHQDPNSGINVYIKSLRKVYPYVICPYIDLMTCLCNDIDNVEMVCGLIEVQNHLTESFSNNQVEDVKLINSKDNVWERINSKIILQHRKDILTLPAGVQGLVYTFRKESRLVTWKHTYSGWYYLLLQLNEITDQPMTFINMAGESGCGIAKSIIELVTPILEHDISKVNEFEPIISAIFRLIQRLLIVPSPPVDVVVAFSKLVQILSIELPLEMWNQLMELKYLPCQKMPFGSTLNPNESMTSIGLFGTILQQVEVREGSYKLTIEYLDFLLTFLKTMTFEKVQSIYLNLVINADFVLKYIFGSFAKWKYVVPMEKRIIGVKCLEIFYIILSSKDLDIPKLDKKSKKSLKELVLKSLCFDQTGESLINIISIGIDATEMEYDEHSSSSITQLVKLCLGILNVLFTKDDKKTLEASPLETALTHQYVQQPSELDFVQITCKQTLVSVIAKYIYHRTDPKLPILSVLVLRSLAVSHPMIITASFGDSLIGLRNAFVHRLTSLVEPLRLKIAIIEFLVTCVESQPGIVDSFTNIVQEKNKDYTFGKFSCLNPILEILEQKDNLDVLTAAALEFLSTLWVNRYDTALSVVKKRKSFWNTLCHPILNAKTMQKSKLMIDITNHLLTILSVECYYIKEDQMDKDLIAVLKSLGNNDTFLKFFELLKPSLAGANQLTLLRSLQTYLSIMKSFQCSASGLQNEKIVTEIFENVLKLLEEWLKAENNKLKSDMIIEISNFCYLMMNKWNTILYSCELLLPTANKVLHDLLQSLSTSLDSILISLYGSVLMQFQQFNNDIPESYMRNVLTHLSIICSQSQYHLQENKSVNGDLNTHSAVLSINILNQIVSSSSKTHQTEILNTLQQYGTIYNILDRSNYYLKRNMNEPYVQAAMLLFLVCAKNKLIAEHLALCGIGQFLCLSIDMPNLKLNSTDVHLTRIWVSALAITSNLVKTLKHSYLESALDFVGTYKELLYQGMNVIEQLVNRSNLTITEEVTILLYNMSNYQHEMIFHLPDVFAKLKVCIAELVKITTALLGRQKILSHLIECNPGQNIQHLISRTKTPSPQSFNSDKKVSQVDAIENSNPDLEQRQRSLIMVLSNGMAFMKNLTPNIIECILDEGMDIDSFNPLIQLNFSSATLEADSPTSFGTLISTLNICLKSIQKASQNDSNRTTPDKDFIDFQSLDGDKKKSQLWFIIDNVLCVLISQSSCYLRHPNVDEREKQFLKRELGSELSNFIYAVHRLRARKGIPASPVSERSGSSINTPIYKRSPSKLSVSFTEEDNSFFRLTDTYTKTLLR